MKQRSIFCVLFRTNMFLCYVTLWCSLLGHTHTNTHTLSLCLRAERCGISTYMHIYLYHFTLYSLTPLLYLAAGRKRRRERGNKRQGKKKNQGVRVIINQFKHSSKFPQTTSPPPPPHLRPHPNPTHKPSPHTHPASPPPQPQPQPQSLSRYHQSRYHSHP